MCSLEDDYRNLHEFRTAIRRFLRFSEDAARSAGLEPQQHQLLLAIKGIGSEREPTIGALSEELMLRHNSTVELVDRLEANGHVRRRRNAEDRRQVVVELTPKGETALRELSRHHRAELESAGPALVRLLETLLEGRDATRARAQLDANTRQRRDG